MGSIGWSLWWAAVLTPLITQRGETMESSQSLCTAFMAWVEKAQHRDFGCTWPWVPEALFDLVTLGDYFTKNEMVSFITPWSQTAVPILSLRIGAVAMRWSHPPKPNCQWTLPRAFSSFFFFSTSARLSLSLHPRSADGWQAPINQAESADDNAARYWSGAIGDIQGRLAIPTSH